MALVYFGVPFECHRMCVLSLLLFFLFWFCRFSVVLKPFPRYVMRTPKPTRSPEFIALNPHGKTPVLCEPDGVVMNESLALLSYLQAVYSRTDRQLCPSPVGSERQAYAQVLARVQVFA